MADVLFVLITVAFFALGALFVRACGGIIGWEEPSPAEPAPAAAAEALEQATESVR